MKFCLMRLRTNERGALRLSTNHSSPEHHVAAAEQRVEGGATQAVNPETLAAMGHGSFGERSVVTSHVMS